MLPFFARGSGRSLRDMAIGLLIALGSTAMIPSFRDAIEHRVTPR